MIISLVISYLIQPWHDKYLFDPPFSRIPLTHCCKCIWFLLHGLWTQSNAELQVTYPMSVDAPTIENWKRVIWSDESSIWVGVNPRRRQWVIHPRGERLNRKYVKRSFKGQQVKNNGLGMFYWRENGTIDYL